MKGLIISKNMDSIQFRVRNETDISLAWSLFGKQLIQSKMFWVQVFEIRKLVYMAIQIYNWRVYIQKGVTHISAILHGGTKTFPFRQFLTEKSATRICF